MVHVNRNYFINNFSKGLYHQLAFEEKLDVIKWVEDVEKKLTTESLKQFNEFEKTITEIEDMSASRVMSPNQDQSKVTGSISRFDVDPASLAHADSKSAGGHSSITVELSLRDTAEQFAKVDSIFVRQVDNSRFKDLMSDAKSVIQEYFSSNNDAFGLWSRSGSYTFDSLKKIFMSSPIMSIQQYSLFGLSVDEISQATPNLLSIGKLMVYLGKQGHSPSVLTRLMFDFEWELLKSKFIASQSILVDANDAAHK